ncbi:hypothetical protein J458_4292, partial [Acinetobacter baumannii 987421]
MWWKRKYPVFFLLHISLFTILWLNIATKRINQT